MTEESSPPEITADQPVQETAGPQGGYKSKGEDHSKPSVLIDVRTRKRVRKAMSVSIGLQQTRVDPRKRTVVRVQRNGRLKPLGYDAPGTLNSTPIDPNQPVVRPLPRREQAPAETLAAFNRPQMPVEHLPRVSLFATFMRMTVWLGAIRFLLVGNLWDRLRKRDSEERRAIRLRHAFERVGGTFVKLGQQMASRLDLLPLRYCEELTKMLDRYPPFPVEQAIEIIERTTGETIDEIFSAFDPEPIGSASIAVVYQAVLRETGSKVAVKVRRPGIRRLFETDFSVLDFIGDLAELFTLIRPGDSKNIREEFRETLSSELNFRREARIQEVFARDARRDKITFFSAPDIIPDYCNEEIIVQEFVSGMWMHEVLAGVEQQDPPSLARMNELNIDPKRLARRLLFMSNWGVYRGLAFHADPHPANILVRANSELVFIDFGATGHFNAPRRAVYMHMMEGYRTNNIWEMAKMAIALAEPLPAVDVNAVTRDVEKNYYDTILSVRSKHSPWYERTTANSWISNLKIMRKYEVSTPQDLLMFARSSLLYDTLAARLNPRVNFYREARRYFEWDKARSNKRGKKKLRELRQQGLVDSIDFQQIERTVTNLNSVLFRMERLFSAPYDFAMLPYIVEKWGYVLTTIFRFVGRSVLVAGIGVAIDSGIRLSNDQPIDLMQSLERVIDHPITIGIVVLLVVIHSRLILFRMGEKTTSS